MDRRDERTRYGSVGVRIVSYHGNPCQEKRPHSLLKHLVGKTLLRRERLIALAPRCGPDGNLERQQAVAVRAIEVDQEWVKGVRVKVRLAENLESLVEIGP